MRSPKISNSGDVRYHGSDGGGGGKPFGPFGGAKTVGPRTVSLDLHGRLHKFKGHKSSEN